MGHDVLTSEDNNNFFETLAYMDITDITQDTYLLHGAQSFLRS